MSDRTINRTKYAVRYNFVVHNCFYIFHGMCVCDFLYMLCTFFIYIVLLNYFMCCFSMHIMHKTIIIFQRNRIHLLFFFNLSLYFFINCFIINAAEVSCRPHEISCDGRCHPPSIRCDGNPDCENGIDEEHCYNTISTTQSPETVSIYFSFIFCNAN